ncbi:MAG: flagellin [Sulfurimonas sp.]|nr:flagellin [Sulfurimonas sp.]
MNAHSSATMNNRNLDNSLAKLSSGLRINTAADDASGLSIANSLRAQASSLGQAVANGNDAIGLIQTADGALSEYSNILNTIKTKTVQAASDTQNTASRLAIQKDIDKLMEELNIIATTTSFNGQKLLSGTFVNKEFQMGANANESVSVNIASATTNSIGQTSRADLNLASDQGGEVSLTMTSATTGKSVTLQTIDVKYDNNRDNSMGAIADQINRYSGETGITAKAVVEVSATNAVSAGATGSDFAINGITIGSVQVSANDSDNTLVNAINSKTSQTGVTATMSSDGKMSLASDGRSIKVEGDVSAVMGSTGAEMSTIGKLELVQQGSAEFQIEGIGAGAVGEAIEISAPATMTKDSLLTAGSDIGAGSLINAGSVVGGDAKVLVSSGTGGLTGTVSSGTQLDTAVKAGSTIAYGSTLSAGTELGGSLLVGSTTAGAANTTGRTALTQDMTLTAGSTIKGGSVLGKGTVITTQFTDNSVTYNVGDVLNANLTLQNGTDVTLTANMTIKDNGSDAQSEIAVDSVLNTGSVLGGNFKVGLKIQDTDSALIADAAGNVPTTVDMMLDADSALDYNALDDTVTIKSGSLLTDASVISLNHGAYSGPDLVTTTGVIKTGDTISGTVPQQFTLAGDQIMSADLTLTGNTTADDTIKAGSILKAGAVTSAAGTGLVDTTVGDTLTGSTSMIVADDMVVKSGSDFAAGTTLLAGTELGDNTYVYGSGTNAALSTYSTSSILAGSVLEVGTKMEVGSTIGGSITTTNAETIDQDMTLKAGSTLAAIDASGNTTKFKAGTLFNQDMVLNTANDGAVATQVTVKAGDVLTQDLFIDGDASSDGVANVTLAKDMTLKKDSIIGLGSTLTVNTENAGTVGLSNSEFTNLSDIDVTTLEGAMKAIDTVSAAIGHLDAIRSELGSSQNQVVSTINNISVTQVNVKAAESNIRDVDFAAESANFSKFNILAQSGSYAMSQANAVQQNVMRLLQ